MNQYFTKFLSLHFYFIYRERFILKCTGKKYKRVNITSLIKSKKEITCRTNYFNKNQKNVEVQQRARTIELIYGRENDGKKGKVC